MIKQKTRRRVQEQNVARFEYDIADSRLYTPSTALDSDDDGVVTRSEVRVTDASPHERAPL